MSQVCFRACSHRCRQKPRAGRRTSPSGLRRFGHCAVWQAPILQQGKQPQRLVYTNGDDGGQRACFQQYIADYHPKWHVVFPCPRCYRPSDSGSCTASRCISLFRCQNSCFSYRYCFSYIFLILRLARVSRIDTAATVRPVIRAISAYPKPYIEARTI